MADVKVEVVRVAAREEPVLRQLVDLYAYDFSELIALDVGEDGRFAFGELAPYWTDPSRHAFFVRAGGRLAGFVLVAERSRLTGVAGVNDMADFFVMRRYRRQGVGARAATEIFARFPGAWEIRQRAENVAATAFWRRVVARYTGGQFRDVTWNDETWQGPVQLFTANASP
jgi:predicted acetyltransferase